MTADIFVFALFCLTFLLFSFFFLFAIVEREEERLSSGDEGKIHRIESVYLFKEIKYNSV